MKSLRTKLFLWYFGSLVILAVFFYVFVHILMVPNSTEYFIGLIILLGIIGFIVIYRLTDSLIHITRKIKEISEKNLYEKIIESKSGDEISQMALEFNRLLDRLNEAFIREKQFIGDVAHELKTPLAVMKTTMEVNKDYRYIPEVDRLNSLVKNVLDLAWSQAPNIKNTPILFELSTLVEEIADIAEKLAIPKKIKVEAVIDSNIKISGFREKLARAILNVVDNAIKYSPDGTKVEISLEKVKDKALIVIKDEGQGISKEEIPYIFDRFYRGAKTGKYFGSGLGLAISKAIVVLHGGDIKVKSSPNRGSTFAIVIPLPFS